jgi:hypothetical protein
MNMKKTILLCILSISVFSCSSDDGGSKSNDYVTDVETLMNKITIEGAVLKNGNIPVPKEFLVTTLIVFQIRLLLPLTVYFPYL